MRFSICNFHILASSFPCQCCNHVIVSTECTSTLKRGRGPGGWIMTERMVFSIMEGHWYIAKVCCLCKCFNIFVHDCWHFPTLFLNLCHIESGQNSYIILFNTLSCRLCLSYLTLHYCQQAGKECQVCEEPCSKPRREGCKHDCPLPCHPGMITVRIWYWVVKKCSWT